MTQIAEGIVFRVSERPWNGKKLYSFKFDGEDGWYRMGEKRFAGEIESGYKIKVKYETDNRGNFQVKAVKVEAKGDPIPAGNGNKGGSGKASGGTGYKNNVDYNAAVARALDHVKALVEICDKRLHGNLSIQR